MYPAGLVPFLQFVDGRSLSESLIICEYLDNAYPNKLASEDPYINAQHKLLVDRFTKLINNFYQVYLDLENGNQLFATSLDQYEKLLTSNFFAGLKC